MFVHKSKKGFTLAEILITLAVIGVVAAIAIPALIGTTNQAELKTALKKAVGVMNQSIMMMIAQDGVDTASFSDSSNMTTEALTNLFKAKLNIITTSGTDTFYTADGMKYTFVKAGTAAGDYCGAEGATDFDTASAKCYVIVDVNGDKGPSAFSTGTDSTSYSYKDKYNLIIKAKAVLPAQNEDNTTASSAMVN
ncbi:MAG: type II secretion system protein [Candidatus Gastranaerophilales bacterium]|nr:type II secretion system protein [Candidatus Gastranaerophilales bacterium]